MRVRISYSVNLNEVPDEAGRMLEELAADLQHVVDLIDELSRDVYQRSVDKETSLETIEKCRSILVSSDMRLADTGMILTGYHDAQEQVVAQLAADENVETEEV